VAAVEGPGSRLASQPCLRCSPILINTTTERGAWAVRGPRLVIGGRPRTGRFRGKALAKIVGAKVCGRAAARGLGDSLCSMAWWPEEREEATLPLFYLPGRRAKAMASGSFATPLRAAWKQLARLSLAIQTLGDQSWITQPPSLCNEASEPVWCVRLRSDLGPAATERINGLIAASLHLSFQP